MVTQEEAQRSVLVNQVAPWFPGRSLPQNSRALAPLPLGAARGAPAAPDVPEPLSPHAVRDWAAAREAAGGAGAGVREEQEEEAAGPAERAARALESLQALVAWLPPLDAARAQQSRADAGAAAEAVAEGHGRSRPQTRYTHRSYKSRPRTRSAPEGRDVEEDVRASLATLGRLAAEGVITVEHLEFCKVQAELRDAGGLARALRRFRSSHHLERRMDALRAQQAEARDALAAREEAWELEVVRAQSLFDARFEELEARVRARRELFRQLKARPAPAPHTPRRARRLPRARAAEGRGAGRGAGHRRPWTPRGWWCPSPTRPWSHLTRRLQEASRRRERAPARHLPPRHREERRGGARARWGARGQGRGGGGACAWRGCGGGRKKRG